MKKNCWLILGTMLSGTLLAQTVTNPPPAAPLEAPAAAPVATNQPTEIPTNAPAKPAKKSGKKKKSDKNKKSAVKKPAYELVTVPLTPGPAVVVASNVNVRGQAKLKSEVLTRLTKGDQVTVLQEIVHNNSGPEEPSAWAKIVMPPGAHVWAKAEYIDTSNESIKPKKLNLRSGPGENFSVIGQLVHGDQVKQLNTKDNWVEIEPPTNAYAFMAAQYLKQEAPAAPTTTTPEPVASTALVTEPPTMANPLAQPPTTPAPETAATPGITNAPGSTNELAMTSTNASAPVAAVEPPPPRIVEREGIVRGMTSIQAPSAFELISAENHRPIDYLYTTSHELDLRRYKGLHIIVSGEESIDDRWPSTPVLTIQRIQVVD